VSETELLVQTLAEAVGPDAVSTDPAVLAATSHDTWPVAAKWARQGLHPHQADVVVRVADEADVVAVLRVAEETGIPVTTRALGSSVTGQPLPTRGGIVLDVSGLTGPHEIDEIDMTVTVPAGVNGGELERALQEAGWTTRFSPQSLYRSSVGGWLATLATGQFSSRYGGVEDLVVGYRVVLADGEVAELTAAPRAAMGPDLRRIFLGSEGTLGVITRVRWRLMPRHDARALALIPLPGLADAAPLLRAVRPRLASLDACEFLTDDGLGLVLEHLGVPAPVEPRAPAYVLLEAAATADPLPDLADALEAAGIEDAVIADDSASRERLWRLRESHTEAISAAGVPHKLDVGVPLDALAPFCDAVRDAMPAGARTIAFGHLGDGNVHVNVLGPDPADGSVDETVLRLVAEHGGTISAEHGVGVAKARFLHLTRSDAEIAAMGAIKAALDPRGILNPGAVISERTAAG
jgi:alkyldihydroxyacetonephosphate synthase